VRKEIEGKRNRERERQSEEQRVGKEMEG